MHAAVIAVVEDRHTTRIDSLAHSSNPAIMAPVTPFVLEDPFEYLEGLGNYHR